MKLTCRFGEVEIKVKGEGAEKANKKDTIRFINYLGMAAYAAADHFNANAEGASVYLAWAEKLEELADRCYDICAANGWYK